MLPPIANLTNIATLWSGATKGVEVADALKQMGTQVRPEDLRHLDVGAYRVDSGSATEAHAHAEHFELVIVWSGSGSLRYSPAKSRHSVRLPLNLLDTAAIPPNTLHEFSADRGETLVLLTIHGLDGKTLTTEQGKLPTTAGESDVIKTRNIRDIAADGQNWETNPKFRARRIRLWGKEARVEKNGDIFERPDVDEIKQQLHLTLYTFVGGQTNPGHFHPHSVEFVVAIDDGALFTVREKNDPDGWAAFGRAQENLLTAGDMVLVPLAAWHQYINTKPNDIDQRNRCRVLALQTPHPIMHTLVNETDGNFGPFRPRAERHDAL